jgi:hypothetical protein
MPKYKVLIVLEEYREVEARNSEMAKEVCYQNYMNNEYELNEMPSFLCEECDLIEEIKNA